MKKFDSSFQTHSFKAPNLLPEEHRAPELEPPRHRHRRGLKFFSCFFIVLLVTFTLATIILAKSNNNFFVGVKNGFFIRQLTHIFTGQDNSLRGEPDDRINALLLGIGGPGHDGPYLTDTIILASFRPSTNDAAMLSIPRDLIIPNGAGSYVKINHVYAYAHQRKGVEHAFSETKRLIGQAFDQPIHYLGVVDFQGFVELVDTMDGITVTVDRAFTDNQFPAANYKIQAVSFKQGLQTMDGLTALRFARSRHGNNGEGSDFQRSKRQQKIILATKEKLASFSTLLSPQKITSLFSLVNQYTKTDIEPWEMVRFVQMAKDVNPDTIASIVLDDSSGGLLRSGISSVDRAYILQPKSGSYLELQTLAESMLQGSGAREEQPKMVLQNGTTIPNLASTIETAFAQAGIRPVSIGNASNQSYSKTIVYDYTKGEKKETRNYLEKRFGVRAETNIPLELLPYTIARNLNLTNETGEIIELDFLIILGTDTLENKGEIIRTLTPEEQLGTSTPTSTPTSTQEITPVE